MRYLRRLIQISKRTYGARKDAHAGTVLELQVPSLWNVIPDPGRTEAAFTASTWHVERADHHYTTPWLQVSRSSNLRALVIESGPLPQGNP